jgi:hypothetical protein
LLQFGQTVLETHRLKPCKSCTNPEIKRDPNLDGLCLAHVEFNGVSACIVNLSIDLKPPKPNRKSAEIKEVTYAAMMALNFALLTLMFLFARRQTLTISLPICSPSRSQSVQIINRSAFRASC